MKHITEQVVREILQASPLVNNANLARQLGYSRSIVSSIRCGKSWTHIDPDTPRPFADHQAGIKCANCIHWSKKIGEFGGCTLEIPESADQYFAKCCNVFTLNEQETLPSERND